MHFLSENEYFCIMSSLRKILLSTAFVLTILHGLLVHNHHMEQVYLHVDKYVHHDFSLLCLTKQVIQQDLGADHLEHFTNDASQIKNIGFECETRLAKLVNIEFAHYKLVKHLIIEPSTESLELSLQAILLSELSFRGPPILV